MIYKIGLQTLVPIWQAYLSILYRMGVRIQTDGDEKVTVVILSYKRMGNIRQILTGVLLCDFVGRVIVSNNNPDIDLSQYIPQTDPRLELIQHKVHRGPSYRYDVAQSYDSEYFICIDDDVFPSPWQLRKMFKALTKDPSRPIGSGGELYDVEKQEWKQILSRGLFSGNNTCSVDVIMHIYAFTSRHLQQYFEYLPAIGLLNKDVHSSEDVIISFTGDDRPIFMNVGFLSYCSTSIDPAVATWQRDGFHEFRNNLYQKMLEVKAW